MSHAIETESLEYRFPARYSRLSVSIAEIGVEAT